MFSRKIYLSILVVLFSVHWIAMAVSPLDRQGWALENVIAVLFVVVLISTYKKFPLSRISYTLIFLFMVLHEVGAHYT